MARFSSMSIATSGLQAAQAGLYVTGHNMSNVDTVGFSRQQAIQQDFFYNTIGMSGNGAMKLGLGTDIAQIRQIRNRYLDISYRQEVTRLGFYEVKHDTGARIDNIIGELESDYKTQTVIQDMWDAINEITLNPESNDVRASFVSTCISFLEKAQDINSNLIKEQYNLNEQIKKTVQDINTLTEKVHQLNNLIVKNEISGDNANDYRDERNAVLDDLALLVNAQFVDKKDGSVDIYVEGKELLTNGTISKLGLRYTSADYSFVEPVFTREPGILEYDPSGKNAMELFTLVGPVNSYNNNDKGSLKAMLVTRGNKPANYMTTPVKPDPANYPSGTADPNYQTDLLVYKKDKFNAENCLLPKTMKSFDEVINKIVSMINNSISPIDSVTGMLADDAPKGIDPDQTQGLEIFVRKTVSRFDATGNYIQEDPNDYFTLYTVGNMEINPLLKSGSLGFSKIAFSKTGDVGDGDIAKDMQAEWKNNTIVLPNGETVNVDGLYKNFIDGIALEIHEAQTYVEEQEILVVQFDNKRREISGVSLDEEMKNMMIFQHAYNASARMINVIDSMIDKIINGTGRVGL